MTKAETDYNALKTSADEAAANQAAADAVIAKINAIGTVAYTAESKAKIDEARTAYDALTEAQKALVPAETLALLTAAETKYAELKAAAEQQTAGSISYATTTVEKTTADGAFTNELTKTGDGTVSYSSSDANVATVNATTGEVTIVGAGTATINTTNNHHGNGQRTGQLQHRECCNRFVQLYRERFLSLHKQRQGKLGMVGIWLDSNRYTCRWIYHHQVRIL